MRLIPVLILTLALAATASANAAMGLGLEMFSMETWAIYVIVTLVFEAWFIGRFFKRSWPASLGISIFANFVTGFGCISLCAVGLHQTFVGSRLNPNPFLNAVVLFTVFGFGSALIESIVWAMFRVDLGTPGPRTQLGVGSEVERTGEASATANPYAAAGLGRSGDSVLDRPKIHNSLLWRSVLAHLIGVPLGLSILLIPSHPYLGTIRATNGFRWHYVEQRLSRDLNQILAAGDPLPCAKSIPDLLAQVPATGWTEPDAWAAGYEADLGRFSMGENRSKPIGELNPAVCGWKAPREGEQALPGKTWVIRRRDVDWASGLVLDRETGQVARSLDPGELGYR